MKTFVGRVRDFNAMYKLQNHDVPTNLGVQRITDFHSIIGEEIKEGKDIALKLADAALLDPASPKARDMELDALTDMADWLGDIIVYATSEALRWGIPIEKVLKIIMDSNASKLDASGKPIYDERGKVMKGPDYWKPEPKIMSLLEKKISSGRVGR